MEKNNFFKLNRLDFSRQLLDQSGGCRALFLVLFNASNGRNDGRMVAVKAFSDVFQREVCVLTHKIDAHMTRHGDVGISLLSLDVVDGNTVILRYYLEDTLHGNGRGLNAVYTLSFPY